MYKKIISIVIFSMFFFSGYKMIFADEIERTSVVRDNKAGTVTSKFADGTEISRDMTDEEKSSPKAASSTTVIVTEKIPGMDCSPKTGGDLTKRTYECTIQPGFGSVMAILKGLIKYATFITALIGVLMLVYSGIEYSVSGANGDDVKHAKGRITKVIAGLVLLFLIGFILNTAAPWIYK